jgi:hypothetical protein
MKKLILILFFSLLSLVGKAQSYGVPDTLVYLQSLVANKAQFIGQSFTKLRDSLKVQIKYFGPYASKPSDMTKETSTLFAFYKPNSNSEVYMIYPCIEVYWEPTLNAGQSDVLFGNTGGAWTSTVFNFYSSGVVSDIKIRN